jgi:hypothetical protein
VSDARLRELERRWKESGTARDEAAYLAEQLRVGQVDRDSVWRAACFGDEAARLALGDEAAGARLDWEIWYTDTFDREMPPQLEVSGAGLLAGLAELWRRTLEQSVGDDGYGTFTRFSLIWGGAGVPRGGGSVPVDPFENPPLLALRRWLRSDPGLPDALARAQARRLRRSLDAPDNTRAVDELLAAALDAGDLPTFKAALAE